MICDMKNFRKILYTLGVITFLLSCIKEPPAQLELSVSEIIVSNFNGTGTLNVTSNGKWTASLSASWCTISPTSGDGNGEIKITTTNNFGEEERGVTLYVSSRNVKRSVRIKQDFSKLETDTDKLIFPKEISSKNIIVTSNTLWQTELPPGTDWIVTTPSNGNNAGEVVVSLSANQGKERTADLKFRFGNSTKVVQIVQERGVNSIPSAPLLKSPINNLIDANRMPTFRWQSSKDADGDEITYTIEYSTKESIWENSFSVKDSLFNLPNNLQSNQRYFWRVKAADKYGGESLSPIFTFTTGIKVSYLDGEYKVAQENTKGVKPSEILFLGDGYISEDFEEGGVFDKDIDEGIEHFFSVEPYKSYREYFKVYKQAAYSRERGATQSDKSISKMTKFKTDFIGGSSLTTDTDEVFKYAKKIPTVDDFKLRDMLVILVVNENRYAGTCWIWSDGRAIAITPVSKSSTPGIHYRNLIMHEAGGHGFGRLADEYVTQENTGKTITDENKQKLRSFADAGFYSNVDLTGDSTKVKWKHFILRPGYARVGTFQGGFYYSLGVWRPEFSSCMVYNEPYYNAPSREAIVKRIMTMAGIQYSLEAFIEKDIEKSPSQAAMMITKSINPFTFMPLAPPVMMP